MSQLFKNKIVLITGASSGFGAEFAASFAAEGARLINIARRLERLEELEKELRSKVDEEANKAEAITFHADHSRCW